LEARKEESLPEVERDGGGELRALNGRRMEVIAGSEELGEGGLGGRGVVPEGKEEPGAVAGEGEGLNVPWEGEEEGWREGGTRTFHSPQRGDHLPPPSIRLFSPGLPCLGTFLPLSFPPSFPPSCQPLPAPLLLPGAALL